MTPTNQPDRSPAPGIIPEPAYVHHHDTPAAATERHREPSLKRRNPLRLLASKVVSALRGDKHTVNAYPAENERAAPPQISNQRPTTVAQ